MKNINIRELALKLKLSASTVSKALRDSHEISEKTKKRVIRAAAQFNYVGNPYASSLRGRKSKNIAIVIPEVADSFFSLAINGIESVAKENGYHVLIYLTHESFENEKAILKEFRGGRVDGVLMSVSMETDHGAHINDLILHGLPLVFFDRVCNDVDTAKVTTNDFESGYLAVEHLVAQGCTEIAFLSISKNLSISKERLNGCYKALANHRLKVRKQNFVVCATDWQGNYSSIKKLLQQNKRPDGIVIFVEKLNTPLYKTCASLNLTIPGDVKVVCFSNLETAGILNPSLTTITQPAFEIGKTAATILFKALSKTNFNIQNERMVIPSTLVSRDSTSIFKTQSL